MVDEVLIIGAGPAGLAAALQLGRYQITPRIFEASRPGGLLWNANRVENYPGFLDGIPGPDLARAFLTQAADIPLTRAAVLELTWKDNLFHARTRNGNYPGKVVVIASGTKPRPLTGFSIPEELHARVFYEIVELLEVQGKTIVIVGSGDAAFDYALNLARKNSVIILNRNTQVKCLPLLWERAQTCQNIHYRPGTAILKLAGSSEGGMAVECSSPQGTADFRADYLVGAVGREPQLDFVSASLLERSAELERMGILHMIGDVKNGIFRQTAVAVGDGIRAGMRIHQVMQERTHESDCLSG